MVTTGIWFKKILKVNLIAISILVFFAGGAWAQNLQYYQYYLDTEGYPIVYINGMPVYGVYDGVGVIPTTYVVGISNPKNLGLSPLSFNTPQVFPVITKETLYMETKSDGAQLQSVPQIVPPAPQTAPKKCGNCSFKKTAPNPNVSQAPQHTPHQAGANEYLQHCPNSVQYDIAPSVSGIDPYHYDVVGDDYVLVDNSTQNVPQETLTLAQDEAYVYYEKITAPVFELGNPKGIKVPLTVFDKKQFNWISNVPKRVDRIGMLQNPHIPVAWKGRNPEMVFVYTGTKWQEIRTRNNESITDTVTRQQYELKRIVNKNQSEWLESETQMLSAIAPYWGYYWMGEVTAYDLGIIPQTTR